MSKVRITTVSGTVLEKPIITCFKSNIGTYLVLDNEKNGTMGLPIILVCRLYQGKLSKIIDQGEWQSVKEELKSIIAKQSAQYESVPADLTADDVYYTQLTLPVNSFEILKNSYVAPINAEPTPTVTQSNVEENIPEVPVEPTPLAQVEQPVIEQTPIQPNTEQAIMPEVPTQQPMSASAPEISTPVMPTATIPEPPQVEIPQPVIQPTPVAPEITPDISQVSPTPVAPAVEIPVAPEMPMTSNEAITEPTAIMPEVPTQQPMPASAPEISAPIMPEAQVMPPTPEAPQTSGKIASEDIEEIKKTFMQACENMFDALIIKFQK